MYAKDWLALVANMEKNLPGVRICPLIPLIISDCPGSLAREISEMAAWLAVVYDNNPSGMLEPWTAVAVATEKLSVGSVTLPNMDTYKVPMPQSLSELSPTCSMTFCAVSLRPVTLKGLPKDTLSDLVRTLLNTVNRDFQSCSCPENLLIRESLAVDSDIRAQKVILFGASNLGYCVERLRKLSVAVVDLTVPGWIATPDNISILAEKLNNIPCGTNDRIALDLYRNLLYRFEQFDSTLSRRVVVTTWLVTWLRVHWQSSGKYWIAQRVLSLRKSIVFS